MRITKIHRGRRALPLPRLATFSGVLATGLLSAALVTGPGLPAWASDSDAKSGSGFRSAPVKVAVAPLLIEGLTAEGVAAVEVKPAPEPTPTPAAATAASRAAERSLGAIAADISLEYQGAPYVWGGASPRGFDCSGLVSMVYGRLGISLPHNTAAIKASPRTTVVSRANALPGDLIWTPGHVSIYLGGNRQMEAHAPGTLSGVYSIWQSNPTFLRVG